MPALHGCPSPKGVPKASRTRCHKLSGSHTARLSCDTHLPLVFSLASLSPCLQVAGLHVGRAVLPQRVPRRLLGAQRPRQVRGLPQLLPGREVRGQLPPRPLPLRGLALRHLRLLPGAAQQVQERPGVGVSRHPQQRVRARVPLGLHHEFQQVSTCSAGGQNWGGLGWAFLPLGHGVWVLCQGQEKEVPGVGASVAVTWSTLI